MLVQLTILILSVALPVLAIALLIYFLDPHKEPVLQVLKMFGLGMLSAVLVLLISSLLKILSAQITDLTGINIAFIFDLENSQFYNSFIMVFISTFLGIALIEELCKWVVVRIGVFHTKEFNEKYDALIYCSYSALGFSFLETILYGLSAYLGTLELSTSVNSFYVALFVCISRAFTALILHVACGVYMGDKMAEEKEALLKGNKPDALKFLLLSLFLPILLHTIYDSFLIYENIILSLLAYGLVLIMDVVILLKIIKLRKNNVAF